MTTEPALGGADLDARYGRRPARRRRNGIVIAGAVLGVLALVWLVWAQPWSTQMFWKSTGYRIIDGGSIAVTWSVTLGDGEAAQCAVAAQNVARAIVGWKVVDVVGTDQPTRQHSAEIRTTEPPDTGLIYRCWLT